MISSSPLQNNLYKQKGFSLLEVLVAVAIIGIALFAVIRSTQQASNTNAYLQDKISANILCADIIANVRTGVIPVASGDQKNGNATILARDLQWELTAESMGESSIERITVVVKKNNKVLASLKTYLALNRDRAAIL
jgi:general secretion pathway protein I